jgi:hypothetical protein
MNIAYSLVVRRADPSTMLTAAESAARRSWGLNAVSFLRRKALGYFVDFKNKIVSQVEDAKFAMVSAHAPCDIQARGQIATSVFQCQKPKS